LHSANQRDLFPNFGKWVGVELSTDNKRQLSISPGFAYGFIVTSESTEFFTRQRITGTPSMSVVCCRATLLGIQWLLDGEPKLAAKDAAGKIFAEADRFD
jgi:dTDP-4-dehydrorhamnose 3,5-epimerase